MQLIPNVIDLLLAKSESISDYYSLVVASSVTQDGFFSFWVCHRVRSVIGYTELWSWDLVFC